jgi:hypothetical protein
MPRNDQIIRQWHLLRKLEGENGVTLDGREKAPESVGISRNI